MVDGILKSNKAVVGKVFADDRAYEGNDIFRCLPDKGILCCVKVRINSKVQLKKGTLEIYPFYPRKKICKSGRVV